MTDSTSSNMHRALLNIGTFLANQFDSGTFGHQGSKALQKIDLINSVLRETPTEMHTSDAEQGKELAEKHGGIWGDHPDHVVSDWAAEVANNDTRLGYWAWVVHRLEFEAGD